MGMLIRRRIEHHARPNQHMSSMRGFSMLEMTIVVSIAVIVSGIAFVNIQGGLKDSRVNGAYDNALMQLRMARERAIEERKRYIVTFGTPAPALALTPLGAPNAKSVQVYRWDAGNPSPAPIQISTIDLPIDVAFQAIAGLPTSAAAVPDGFGNGSKAIDFDQGVGPGGGNLVMFMPDGSAVDLLGNSNNGVLYLARNGDMSSTRAVTVFGTSGRIRGWGLTFPGGIATWKQQ